LFELVSLRAHSPKANVKLVAFKWAEDKLQYRANNRSGLEEKHGFKPSDTQGYVNVLAVLSENTADHALARLNL
jgi:hypothetical protein